MVKTTLLKFHYLHCVMKFHYTMVAMEKCKLGPMVIVILLSGLISNTFGVTNYTISRNSNITKSGCPTQCGNLTIQYPFGVGRGCGISESFEFNCTTNNTNHQPQAFIGDIRIYEISDNQLRVFNDVRQMCYPRNGSESPDMMISPQISSRNYSYSEVNKFTIIGCDSSGYFGGNIYENDQFYSHCMTVCPEGEDLIGGDCSGVGCCQSSWPKGISTLYTGLSTYRYQPDIMPNNLCNYLIVGDMTQFQFQGNSDLTDPNFIERVTNSVPYVFDWAIGGNLTCGEAQRLGDYACKNNSNCIAANNTGLGGYHCVCNNGFEGNPYLGCTDIDECANPNKNDCERECINMFGTFNCSCPLGYFGDGRKGKIGCKAHQRPFPLMKLVSGLGIVFLAFIVAVPWLHFTQKRRKIIKLREKFFQQNGGLLLRQQISSSEGLIETTKIFKSQELEKATNNYAEDRILGKGGYGTVYKGILPDNRIVAIKKSIIMDETQIEQFINEVVILTQVIHRNVVKLLGCCLECEVPLLVYEYVPNGTLFEHIHNKVAMSWLSLENRLRIALEAACALSYLHSATSTPVIHRDVKSANILLDENYIAKVSDFGASRLITLGKTEVTTMVQGTLGYLDPEYFLTSQLTEKSDVYSFGVVLAELLTGKQHIDIERTQKERSLAVYFIQSMRNNRVFQILDPQVVREGSLEQIKAIAELIKRCLELTGEERPTMKEVVAELENCRKFSNHPWEHRAVNEENIGLMNDLSLNGSLNSF